VEGGRGRQAAYAIARQDDRPMAFAGLWESFSLNMGSMNFNIARAGDRVKT
jgi:putative SOS response-associated peptidase YedK